jgi:hypothetical protein
MTQQKLRKGDVAKRYGNVNVRTVDRWLADPTLNFPKPIFVGRAPLWDLAQLTEWEITRARPGRPQVDSAASATP